MYPVPFLPLNPNYPPIPPGNNNSPQHNRRQAVGGQPRRHGHCGRGRRRGRLRGAPQVPAVRILQQGVAEEGHGGY